MLGKNLLFCCVLLLGRVIAQAQDSTSAKVDTVGITMKTSVNKINLKPQSNLGKLAVGLKFGTTPGFDVSFQFSKHFALRGSYNFFNYTIKDMTAKSSNEDVIVNGDAKMEMYTFGIDFYPSVKSSFKIFGGVASVSRGALNVIVTPTKSYSVSNIVFTPEKLGTFNLGVDYSKTTAPFVGIGFGRSVPIKRVGFGFEGGTFILNSPTITLEGTRYLTGMNSQQPLIQSNMNDWKYYPILNFRLAIRLN